MLRLMTRRRIGRPLLLASIGVATVAYVACSDSQTVGNLMAYPYDASTEDSAGDAGNFGSDAHAEAASDSASDALRDVVTDAPADASAEAAHD